jgi:DNA-binding transcriptional ArsR family regulator
MDSILDREAYQQKATIIKAMAHPSRLIIIDALAEGERCVCELQRLVGSDLSTVSKHLSVMKRAGIVTDRKEGLQVFYRLRVPCVLRFFDCVDAVLRANSAEVARSSRW